MLLRCAGVVGDFGVLGVLRTCFATANAIHEDLDFAKVMESNLRKAEQKRGIGSLCSKDEILMSHIYLAANYPCLIHFTRLPVE